jgi:hypothetical protein
MSRQQMKRTLQHGRSQLQDQIVAVSLKLTRIFKAKTLLISVADSEIRTVKLTNLPTIATHADVFALVWGGDVQALKFTPGSSFAEVQFLRGGDCAKYIAATTNNILWPKEPTRFIKVEKCDPEPSHDMVKGYIERGITRCVRVFDANQEWGKTALDKFARGKAHRSIERIANGQNAQGASFTLT